MSKDTKKIWFITGISSGLGKSLAEAVSQHGDVVIGTFRNEQQVTDFTQRKADNQFAVQLDITQPDQIRLAVQTVIEHYGRIDVLVNNAGYGFAGAVEEASEAEIRAVFDANFFGTLALTQAFLPQFRQQKSGHIIQISSQAGVKATPGFGIYNASKFALEGVSEALAAEIAPLGIHLTLVEPGPFRTNFAGSSFGEAEQHITDYNATAGVFRQRMQQVNGNQEGDPVKAAEAIWNLTRRENPPLRMPLGKIALASITAKIDSLRQDVEAGRAVAEAVVFG
jgi:NAD(P)-dependent dehydrogenase (short-subunit alcohol dehydrogenase family)